MNILYKKSESLKNLEEYSKLYFRCFNKQDLNMVYLNWLYNKNPDGNFIGIDCYEDKNLIGQVGGIPFEFFWNKKKLRILISVNVCVDERYRGQNLFSKMAKKFENYAKEKNIDGIIAIGNKLVTPAWVRSIGLINLCQLDSFIGFGKIKENNFDIDKYNFYSFWNNRKLNWRIKNPKNQTYLIGNKNKIKSVYSKTKYPLIKAYAPMIFYENDLFISNSRNNNFSPFVFLGKIYKIKNKNIFKLPELLKPSPLNFLYKFFNIKNNLTKDEIYFTFLDFDIF